MWRDVFLANKDAVLEMLGRFNEDLSPLTRAIRRGDGEHAVRSLHPHPRDPPRHRRDRPGFAGARFRPAASEACRMSRCRGPMRAARISAAAFSELLELAFGVAAGTIRSTQVPLPCLVGDIVLRDEAVSDEEIEHHRLRGPRTRLPGHHVVLAWAGGQDIERDDHRSRAAHGGNCCRDLPAVDLIAEEAAGCWPADWNRTRLRSRWFGLRS